MKPLLLVIDLQEGWRHAIATEQTMLRTVELCKKYEGDIIHSRFRNDPESLFHKQLGWYRFVEPRDTDDMPEAAALNLNEQWRTTYSCLTEEMIPVVKAYERGYVAGVFTDISVAATVMGIFDLGVPVSVVIDCVATLHGEAVQKSALNSIEMAIGAPNLITSGQLLKSY